MFGASFGVISQALEIYRKSLDIYNRNVLNANNPDYVQEDPLVESFAPAGINFREVKREQNIYYLNLRNTKLSLVRYLEERSNLLANVEGIFQELLDGTGINDYANRFFKAYLDLMKDPTNQGAKNELVTSAKALSGFLNEKVKDIDRLNQSTDYTLDDAVSRANELIRKLYILNKDITVGYAQTYARGRDYKNLLDTRDKYLRELSELINVNIQEDDIGRVKLTTSKGFALLDYTDSYWQLEYAGGRLLWRSKSSPPVDITDVVESGKIKALLDAREDLSRFKEELNDIAKYLISTVKIPRENSNSWFLIQNVDDPTLALSNYGLDGNLDFYDNSTSPPTLISSITNYGSLSLNDLANAINTDPALSGVGISATVVNNPDGTYTLRIDVPLGSYSITDSGNNFFESSPVFVGNDASDISPVSTLDSDLDDLDYALTDNFSDFANGWWQSTKGYVNTLISDISDTQADVKDKLRIEDALLQSLDRRLQEMQGVSIDREFMEIMKVRRTYEAVAKIVSTIDELIQTTLNM